MIEYKSGERLGYIKKSPHSPECVSSIEIYKRNIDEYWKENKKMDDFTMNRYILDNLSYRIKELSVPSKNRKEYLKNYADMAFKDKKQ